MIAHFEDKEKKENIVKTLKKIIKNEKKIILFCVGTDRCTGDSLGPLLGEKMKRFQSENFFVYGDLKNPVHAKNLNEKIREVEKEHNEAFVIAVDATIGHVNDVGYIFLKQGPLDAGSALEKDLQPIGHMHIGGIVNSDNGDILESLQNTRLYIVMEMVNYIEEIIKETIN